MNSTRAGPKKTFITSKHQLILETSENHLKPIRTTDRSDQMDISLKHILGDINMKATESNNNSRLTNKLKTIPPISPSTQRVN